MNVLSLIVFSNFFIVVAMFFNILTIKKKKIMSSNDLKEILRNLQEGDLKETIYYEESEHNHNTYYADLLNNGKYVISQDENYLKVVETEVEAINEVKRLSKGK